MARTTRKSLSKNILALIVVVLLTIALALQVTATSAFFDAPTSGNNVDSDPMNGVSVKYTDAPDWALNDYDYRLTDGTVKSESKNARTPKPNEQVSVIIKLAGTPMMQYASGLNMSVSDALKTSGGQSNLNELNRIRKLALNDVSEYLIDYRSEYMTIMNAFSATIKYEDVANIEKSGYVQSVILSNTYLAPQAVTENIVDVYESGIFDSSDIGYDGTGTVVAVLDTGTDYTHEVFDMELDAEKIAITKDDVAAVAPLLTATSLSAEKGDIIDEDDLYLGTKLPFAYDYADSDANVYPHEAHGTHVAGIIAGKSDVITGVAPGAQIATFKVFSDYRSGARTEAILDALNDAVTLGVDAINMSLGTSCGFSREVDEDEINQVYDDINDAGICLVVAASNDASSANNSTWGNTNLATNPDSGTVGSPASYNASFAVASVSGVKTKYFMYEGKEKYFAESRLVGKTKPNDFVAELLGDKEEGEFEFVVVGGTGDPSNYIGLDVKGKIAVVRRGISNFEDKVSVAKDNGAIAVIVYNNVSGTISMSVGTTYRIPSCFVTMDLSEDFVAAGSGTIKLSKSYLAGPFMSDFSSWGALPDLTLAPDITAHGGEILSSYPGGDQYDRISGTSMASPNMAGALILVRQYVKEQHPEYTTSQIRDESYSRVMSTATIVRNEQGNPYSPRKQGAGLADIAGSIKTPVYLTVDGSNKPKLSLGDDPSRSGVYDLKFNIVNTSGNAVSYNLKPYVMTESMSADGITVAEKAYLFNDTTNTYKITATKGKAVLNGNSISLSGYGSAVIEVQIALSDADKNYLNTNFGNGMYVEGFVMLESNVSDGTDLSIPYMAFYGDWSAAPMLDKSAYEVGESEMEYILGTITEEDKVKADVVGTLPYAGFASATADDGIAYYGMGEFAYIPALGYEATPPQEKYAALTCNPDGDYMFYGLSAGLLRGARRVEMEIRDSVTGELIWEGVDYNARKAHSNGGQPVGGFVTMELDIRSLNLPNNMKCTFNMKCFMDWKDGTYGNNNTFSFDFTIDNEKPELHDVAVRKVKSGNSYKYELELSLYDNHYIQGYALATYNLKDSGFNPDGSVKDNLMQADVLDSKSITNGLVPNEKGGFNTNSKFTFDITPYWSTIQANKGVMLVNVMDYAKNQNGFFVRVTEETDLRIEKNNNASDVYSIATNGQLDLMDYIKVKTNTEDDVDEDDKAYTEGYWNKNLIWESSDKSVVDVNDEGIITGLKEGTAVITVRTPNTDAFDENDTKHCLKFTVNVTSEIKDIVLTGLEFDPETVMLERGEEVTITAKFKPHNYTGTHKINWSSTSSKIEIVSVSEDTMSVTVRAKDSGAAQLRATVDGTRVNGTCTVRVMQEFVMTNNVYLRSYNGRGDENGVVEIPDDLGIAYIYPNAFAGNEYIKKVIIPEGVTTIMRAAFVNCSALEEVVLPDTLETIEENAFANDNNLKSINLGKVKTIGEGALWGGAMEEVDLSSCTYIDGMAFFNCKNLKSLDLSRVGIIGGGAFALCTGLENLEIPANVSMSYIEYQNGQQVMPLGAFSLSGVKNVTIHANSVGKMAFYACENLANVTFVNDVNVIDEQAFYGCTSLTNVNYNKSVYEIGYRAFAKSGLKTIVLPSGLTVLGQQAYYGVTSATTIKISSGALLTYLDSLAFGGTNVNTFIVEDGNIFLSSEDGVLFDRAKKRLVAYPWRRSIAQYTVPDSVITIGASAFDSSLVGAVNLGKVKYIESGAFSRSSVSTVTSYDNLEYIGNSAFAYSAMKMLPITDKTKYIGDSAFVTCPLEGSYIDLIIPKNVNYLGSYAFAHTPLVSVSFVKSTLKEAGDAAFAGCEDLATVNLGSLEKLGASMFGSVSFTYYTQDEQQVTETYTLKKLKSIIIPNTVKEMGVGVFENSALESVEIPTSITALPDYAFAYTKLASISIPASVQSIGASAFRGTLIETVDLANVENIGDYAFAQTPVKKVKSDKVTTVGAYAFYLCVQLESVNFSKALNIGGNAFFACSSLSEVGLESATVIGPNAFGSGKFRLADNSIATIGCTALESISLGNAETIGENAFVGATNLKSITLGKVKFIGASAFSGTAITALELPATLMRVADGAFIGAEKLAAINVAESNVSYKSEDGVLYAIMENNLLVLVGYPAGKTDVDFRVSDKTIKLGAYSFNANPYIENITLSAYVQVIGHAAMYGTNIKSITLNSATAPTLESEGKMVTSLLSSEFTNTYANFGFALEDADKEHDLVITIPSNNSGYDNRIWKQYVGKYITVSDKIHATTSTLDFIERVKALPNNITAADAEEINTLARLYNILSAAQKQFVLGTYSYTDSDNNTIDSAYYTELLGGINYYTMLQNAQSKLPKTASSAVEGGETAFVAENDALNVLAIVSIIVASVAVAVAAIGIALSKSNKRSGRR